MYARITGDDDPAGFDRSLERTFAGCLYSDFMGEGRSPTAEAAERALSAGAQLTLVVNDPRRDSWFAVWTDDPAGWGLFAPDGADDVTMFLPERETAGSERVAGGRSPRFVRREVSVLRWPLRDALPVLAARPIDAAPQRSATAWSVVVRCGLSLIARGRLHPAVSPDNNDGWRIGPLVASERRLRGECASALPASAHCLAHADNPRLMMNAEWAVEQLWHGLADLLATTAVGERLSASHLFASPRPTKVPQLRDWTDGLAALSDGQIRVAAQLQPPASADASWSASIRLRTTADASVIVSPADLGDTDPAIARMLGVQPMTELATICRAASLYWPSLIDFLHDFPPQIYLTDAALGEILRSVDELASLGLDLHFPADVATARVTARLVAPQEPPPTGAPRPPLFDADGRALTAWDLSFDGDSLTSSEFKSLVDATQPLVQLRGQWVRVDAAMIEAIRKRPPQLAPGELADAVRSGELALDHGGQRVLIAVDNRPGTPWGDLKRQLETAGQEVDSLLLDGLDALLRPYQQTGAAWLADLAEAGFGACLADDMGLGKTLQVIAFLIDRRNRSALREPAGADGPTLIVCPTSLLANWASEIGRFAPGLTVHTYHGSGRALEGVGPGDVVITTYGVVRSAASTLIEHSWGVVVADEAQHMKNPHSATSRAIRRIAARVRIALTGTPVENHLMDLWSILDWVAPGVLGPLEKFRREVAISIERDRDRDVTRALHHKISPFLLRRRKTDPAIAPDLPERTEHDLSVPPTTEQAALYQAVVNDHLRSIAAADGITRRGRVLAMLTALKQITNHPAHYLGDGIVNPTRSSKLTLADELVDAALAGGERTLVFTQFVQMGFLLLEHFQARGIKVDMLHGALNPQQRGDMVDRFQRGDLDVLILSLRAGGTGLNLTAATQVIHYDRWWNPAVEDQATDRAHRIGQTRHVQVYRLITEGTLEERIAELLADKRALAERVVGTSESWITELDDADLATLVLLRSRADLVAQSAQSAQSAQHAPAATPTADASSAVDSDSPGGTVLKFRAPDHPRRRR